MNAPTPAYNADDWGTLEITQPCLNLRQVLGSDDFKKHLIKIIAKNNYFRWEEQRVFALFEKISQWTQLEEDEKKFLNKFLISSLDDVTNLLSRFTRLSVSIDMNDAVSKWWLPFYEGFIKMLKSDRWANKLADAISSTAWTCDEVLQLLNSEVPVSYVEYWPRRVSFRSWIHNVWDDEMNNEIQMPVGTPYSDTWRTIVLKWNSDESIIALEWWQQLFTKERALEEIQRLNIELEEMWYRHKYRLPSYEEFVSLHKSGEFNEKFWDLRFWKIQEWIYNNDEWPWFWCQEWSMRGSKYDSVSYRWNGGGWKYFGRDADTSIGYSWRKYALILVRDVKN